MPHNYAIFSARFEPLTGGVESFTSSLGSELAKQGNSVTIVTQRITDSPECETRDDGISIIRLPATSLLNGRLPIPIRNKRHRELLASIQSKEIDRVLVNNRFYAHSLDGLAFAESVGTRAIMLDHGSAYLTLGNPLVDSIIQKYEHSSTEKAKRYNPLFCGISTKSARWLETFGISTDLVIPNAIDANWFRSIASERDFRNELALSPDCTLVAFAGRLAPEKGAQYLIEAARSLNSENVVFALAGDGSMRKELESLAGFNVHLLGLLSRSDLSALMRDADVFCLPTRSEGFCTSLLEASVWSTPPVITDVGGAKEVIPDVSHGIIMADTSAHATVESLKQILRMEPSLRRTMGEKARKRVEQFNSWQASVAALDEAFKHL